MNIKLLTEHNLEFLSLHFVNEAAHAGMSLHFSKYHIVRNYMAFFVAAQMSHDMRFPTVWYVRPDKP